MAGKKIGLVLALDNEKEFSQGIDYAKNDRLNIVESHQMTQDARIEFLQDQLMEARSHIARQDAEIARLSGLLEGAA
ncbi:MAG: hypothetical protein SOX32_05530 [Candidatus Choladocola sp.]|nr:hypothetical protein [Candidatus Choladocola sp.]